MLIACLLTSNIWLITNQMVLKTFKKTARSSFTLYTRESKKKSTHLRHHIGYEKGAQCRFLVVVLDVDVYHVNWLIVLRIPGLHKVDDLIVDSFLGGDNQFKSIRAMLELLGFLFNASISVQHMKQSVLCVTLNYANINRNNQIFFDEKI